VSPARIVSIGLAVEEALEAGLSAEDAAKAFAEVLRERRMLSTASDVVPAVRAARKT